MHKMNKAQLWYVTYLRSHRQQAKLRCEFMQSDVRALMHNCCLWLWETLLHENEQVIKTNESLYIKNTFKMIKQHMKYQKTVTYITSVAKKGIELKSYVIAYSHEENFK